jgi:hypothetical protein
MSDKEIPVERLVKAYVNIRAAYLDMKKQHEAEQAELQDNMERLKEALLQHCKDNEVESVRTNSGTFYRTVKTNYWTNDWESFGRFVVEHNVPELLEKRINQTHIKQFLEENPDLLPPGLNVESKYSVTVRSK